MEKVKIAAKEAQPKVKIMTCVNFSNYNLLKRKELRSSEEINCN